MLTQILSRLTNQFAANQYLTVEAARVTYLRHRVEECKTDPAELACVLDHLMQVHRHELAATLAQVINDRVGSVEQMISLVERGAEDLAQAEWGKESVEATA